MSNISRRVNKTIISNSELIRLNLNRKEFIEKILSNEPVIVTYDHIEDKEYVLSINDDGYLINIYIK